MMNKVLVLIFFGLILSGCSLLGIASQSRPVVSEDINVTKMGTLAKGNNGIYLLQEGQGKSTQLHDGNATLESYVGKKVTVTGQYSGTTLYVDKVGGQ